MELRENQPLAELTTFGIGGPARWFAEANTEADVEEAVRFARQHALPLFVLGGGSNLLVADEGFSGLVLRMQIPGIRRRNDADGTAVFQMGAGIEWDAAVEGFLLAKCAGAESLAGIPGTVGGTPVQNVGAYGCEVGELIDCVRVFDTEELKWVELSAAECNFAYRHSRFNTVDRGRYIVSRVDYRLRPGGEPLIRYAELERQLAAEGGERSLLQVANVVRRLRRSKGMLMVDDDVNCHSAGSFFKNPFVSEAELEAISKVAEKPAPRFAAPDAPGKMKVPAAWLIEQAGFAKGYGTGRAGVSDRHTLALVNRGQATAADVLALAAEIRAGVAQRFGIRLEMEPVRLGFAD